MPFISYNTDIPDAPNDPSADQPLMKTNTNAVNTILAVDHFTFQDNDGGWHKQSTYKAGTAPATASDQGAVYTKNSGGGVINLFYRRESNGAEIQLTNAALGGVGLINSAAVFKAFGVANGPLAGADILYSYNIGNIEKNGTGDYTITFTTNLPSANYVVNFNFVDDAGSAQKDLHAGKVITGTRAAGSYRIQTRRTGNQDSDDPIQIMICTLGG